MKQFNIGDIVFVNNYEYKSGNNGKNHIFVLVDDGQAIEINDYFGFLLSSKTEKATYPYNEKLTKNDTNGLHKDSIVKCDDLIEIVENNIQFKIRTSRARRFRKIYWYIFKIFRRELAIVLFSFRPISTNNINIICYN